MTPKTQLLSNKALTIYQIGRLLVLFSLTVFHGFFAESLFFFFFSGNTMEILFAFGALILCFCVSVIILIAEKIFIHTCIWAFDNITEIIKKATLWKTSILHQPFSYQLLIHSLRHSSGVGLSRNDLTSLDYDDHERRSDMMTEENDPEYIKWAIEELKKESGLQDGDYIQGYVYLELPLCPAAPIEDDIDEDFVVDRTIYEL